MFNESNDHINEIVDNVNKSNDDIKKSMIDSLSIDLSNLPYPPGYSITKLNDVTVISQNQMKTLNETEQENTKEPRMTKAFLKQHCTKNKLYQTPHLNDVLYLHYNGFSKIENLDEYTNLKCLFLDVNGILKIDGLHNQHELRSLYLSKNLLRHIENLNHMKYLDTLDVSYNMISRIDNLNMLPNFTKLIISHNKLTEIDDLIHLIKCEKLSVLDIQHNSIKDPNVVEEIFAKMLNLRVLYNQGNPFIREVKNYRKNVINQCKQLTYLDDRPVFPKDRACAEAFYAEGIEKEREVRQQWNDAEQKKILDSVKCLSKTRKRIEAEHREKELRKQAKEAGLPTDDIHIAPGDIDWLYGDISSMENKFKSDNKSDNEDSLLLTSYDTHDDHHDPDANSELAVTHVFDEVCTNVQNLTTDNTELRIPMNGTSSCDNVTISNEQNNNDYENKATTEHSTEITKIESISFNEDISFIKVHENNTNNSIFNQLTNDTNNHNVSNKSNLLSILKITDNCNHDDDDDLDNEEEQDEIDKEFNDEEIDNLSVKINNMKTSKNFITTLNNEDQLDETVILNEETIKENIPSIPKLAFIEELSTETSDLNNNDQSSIDKFINEQENFMNSIKTNND
ncbi:Dynein assembly factor 1, axonemal isoform 1 [Schistosoma japonicum]|uniref:Dynein assembly factor 1, axonemal isoform 1 n=1 Tax=Schistosoma japonicum TaxID=6182 RepID=A0A4Z2CWE1_SCHJA|nr:Dynein assembly factor 1, axonemal isoform 1 [Schistosoma japonicum]